MGGIPYLCSQMRLEYGNRMRMNNTRIMKWKFRLMCFKSIFLRLILESRLLDSGTALLRHNLEEDKFDFQINFTQNFLVSVRQRTEMSSSDRISDSYVGGHNSDEINNIFSSSDRISDLLVRKQRKVMIKVGSPFFASFLSYFVFLAMTMLSNEMTKQKSRQLSPFMLQLFA